MSTLNRLAVLTLAIMAVSACAPSALSVQARAATAARPLLEQSHDEIIEARGEALTEAVDSAESPEEARQAVESIQERFAPVVAAYEAARALFTAWVDALLAAADGDSDGEYLELAVRFASQFERLVELADHIGVGLRRSDDGQ